MTRKRSKKKVVCTNRQTLKLSSTFSSFSSLSTFKGETDTLANEALGNHSRNTSCVSVQGTCMMSKEDLNSRSVSGQSFDNGDDISSESGHENTNEGKLPRGFDKKTEGKAFRRRCNSISVCSSLKHSHLTDGSFSSNSMEAGGHSKDSLSASSVNGTKHTSIPESPKWSFFRFFEDQTFLSSAEELQSVEFESPTYLASKRKSVYNFLQIPWHLEALLLLGASVCADTFLFLFTFLPIRSLIALCRPLYVLYQRAIHHNLKSRCTLSAHESLTLIHLTIMICVSSLLFCAVDVSRAYHNIRGQTAIKLYVLFNVMEIFDKLLCSFGQDTFDSLACSVNELCQLQHTDNANGQRLSSLLHVICDSMLSFLYVGLHSIMLIYWVVTLNVAINSHNNALLTLLVSNQFVEVKGSVFKAIRLENLFQISCADSVERFQLCVFLSVTCFQSQGKSIMLFIWLLMWFAETLIDWIKHAFVTKFNGISYKIYQQFSLAICMEIVQSKLEKSKKALGVGCLSKKIGFVSLPLGCLTIRMTWKTFITLSWVGRICVLFLLLIWKLLIDICLTSFAVDTLKNNIQDTPGDLADKNHTLAETLQHVRRYEFIQGKGTIH
ncbi:hypothetical protein Gasu_32840 isoform 1 [Galdieria sulphuraria]|uniref:Uncharacterized protein n=1 Tax=Galdieria sulphuraria TaxID=130081 RepID=M2Y0B2_GALSU|nr:hypothetical protein Gasu_32840 isoform 1 [Galdieria sulphuraria]EME29274.1 hypothetical protein isoform 1 [Galdieria sulphuraria]|eukprot:XP_005705794.1 hypothetical protein isoform 1 [Galdieria sulphuraria]